MKKSIETWGIELDKTIRDWALDIWSQDLPRNGVVWESTYDITSVPEKTAQKLFQAAMPHTVKVRDELWNQYPEIYDWIEDNEIDGLWTHSNIYFRFQYELDAIAFKLRWG